MLREVREGAPRGQGAPVSRREDRALCAAGTGGRMQRAESQVGEDRYIDMDV